MLMHAIAHGGCTHITRQSALKVYHFEICLFELYTLCHPVCCKIHAQFLTRGDEFYATANTLGLHQRKDPKDNVEKMVQDLEKQ